MEQTIRFIGKIQSKLKRIENCPLQESENAPGAEIIIFQEFIEGIQDMKEGSEIILLTWLHQANRTTIKTQPRNNPDAPFVGVFSTRSPHRPNPIGIHVVKVISVNGNGVLKVSALEVLDQTPLVDIKPVWN